MKKGLHEKKTFLLLENSNGNGRGALSLEKKKKKKKYPLGGPL